MTSDRMRSASAIMLSHTRDVLALEPVAERIRSYGSLAESALLQEHHNYWTHTPEGIPHGKESHR